MGNIDIDLDSAERHPPTQRARQIGADRHWQHEEQEPDVGSAKDTGERRRVDREHQPEQAEHRDDLESVAAQHTRRRRHAAMTL